MKALKTVDDVREFINTAQPGARAQYGSAECRPAQSVMTETMLQNEMGNVFLFQKAVPFGRVRDFIYIIQKR